MTAPAALQGGARPLIKWAGGKRQLLPELLPRLPRCFNRYCEPFVGGGALFFALQPQRAWLSDSNAELINLYVTVRDHCEALLEDLRRHENTPEYFLAIRNLDRSPAFAALTAVEKASRFIYLNRTCFNGLYRVNARGQFNVPFGRYKNPRLADADNLRRCSQLLQDAQLRCGDFSALLEVAEAGDFVYLDPPYVPLSPTSSFTSYTSGGFGEESQRRLREVCDALDERGVYFMLSNSDCPLVRELYSHYRMERVQASRAISAAASGRGAVAEALVRNYDQEF